MCGIVWVKKEGGARACKTVFKRFSKQRDRGLLGFGYIAIDKGKVVSLQRAKYETDIRKLLMEETASEILFHHRKPTSTPNFIGATHPIIIQNDAFEFDYVVMHNGTVSNSDELRKEHEKLDFKYHTEYILETEVKTETTESLVFENGFVEKDSEMRSITKTEKETKYNDSEALAYELALLCEGWKDTIDTQGGVATIFYQLKKDGTDGIIGATVNKLFYTRNTGRPLVLETQGKKRKKNGMAIIKSKGEGKKIDDELLYSLDYSKDMSKVVSEKIKLGKWYSYNHRNDQSHHVNNVHSKHINGFADRENKTGEYHYDGIDKFPRPYHEEENNVDDGRYKDEMRLVEELEAEEAKGWQDKAEEIVDDMEQLMADINEYQTTIETLPGEYEVTLELIDAKAELKAKQAEYISVQDKLIELDLPIPSTIPFTINY